MKVLYVGGTGEISQACVTASIALGHEVDLDALVERILAGQPAP